MAEPSHHQVTWTAAGLRRAAKDNGIDLPVDYSRRVAADGITRCDQLGVTKMGAGVVIHTLPGSPSELPNVVGYADGGGQWYRDGSQHHTAGTPVSDPLADTKRAESSREAAS